MPKFVVTETVPCVQIWTYEVEANSETEALEMALNVKAETVGSINAEYDYENAQYEIEDEDGDVYDVERDNDNNTQDDDDEDFLSSVMFGVDNKQ